MIKNILSFVAFSILGSISIAAPLDSVPTWSGDVACIVYSHCSSCHNPTSIAPFSLLTYQDAWTNMQSIKHDVSIGKMPPYLPNTSYRHYTDMRVLTTQEINTIAIWVNAGGPLGDTTQAPPQPVYTSSVAITNPDLTARIPDYTVPNTGADLYRCFIITNPQAASHYISEVEVIPGDRSAVHHVLVFADNTNTPITLDSADPGPGYTNFGGTGSNNSTLIAAWVPGSDVYTLPAGMGIQLAAGSRIIIQIHYPVGAQGKLDSTRVNLKYTTASGIRNVTLDPILNHVSNLYDGPLTIPADSVRTFHERYTTPYDVTILSVAPHAHLVCTQMKAFYVTTAHDTVPIIDIDNWDFHWQGLHSFQKPIKVPAHSTMYGIAHYDNTVNNPNSPRPINTVTLGESTTNEMMLFYFAYLYPYVAGDENIIVDTTSHTPHYLNCVSNFIAGTTGISDLQSDVSFMLFPDPAQSILSYQCSAEIREISIRDIAGKTVKIQNTNDKQGQLYIGDMNTGLYFVSIKNQNGASETKRFVKE